VNPSLPPKSVPELIDYAKANPGKVTMASAGIGSAPHMYWELFRAKTGVNMVHVPYRGGGPAVADLLGDHVDAYIGTSAAVIGYVRADKLRALGVTSAKRLPALPDIPAIGEFVPGYEATIYVGIAAPHGTPTEIVNTLNHEVNLSLADPTMTAKIVELGDAPLALSPSEFEKLALDEKEKWAEVIKSAGVRAE
jgi:tripartite-type tricarboxylate transporter receptor subunit TctC